MRQKTLADHFADWEAHTFGYGYGTGEEYIVPSVKTFLSLCTHGPYEHSYNYRELEDRLTPTVAWLLINIFCQAQLLAYGTSPRGAWLTPQGQALQQFVAQYSSDELYEMTGKTMADDDYDHCYPDWCNCPDGQRCHNPFWVEQPIREG